MSYLEQLQIKKTPVKNSDFVILLGETESAKKEKEEKKMAKKQIQASTKEYNEQGELEADYDE